MTTLICDIEADGLLDTVENLWQLSIVDAASGRLSSFNRDTLPAGLRMLEAADTLVFHNGLGYDLPAIAITTGVKLDPSKVVDTLVLSRLARPDRKGGHSLSNWGSLLGQAKPEHEDWSQWTPAMQVRCDEDVKITHRVYDVLRPMLEKYPDAVRLEHEVAWAVTQMTVRGIEVDVEHCRRLHSELLEEQENVLRDVRQAFTPILVPKDSNATRRSKSLKNVNRRHPLYGQLDAGVEYTPLVVQQFNPASRTQVARRLIQKYGWKPTAFTPGGAAEISEETLGDLPYPEAQVFARYLKVDKLIGFLASWLEAERRGRIHSSLNPLGTVTGRPSAASPNLQQVPRDKRLRAAFRAGAGRVLVGADASGLELRMLGHYLARFDGGAYASEVVEGDIHAKVCRAIGFDKGDFAIGRDYTKNIEYGMIYGAGNPKLGQIARKCFREQGVTPPSITDRAWGGRIRKAVKEAIPGYATLDQAVRDKADRHNFIKGLDGRRIWIRSEHSALNFLLQSAGIIVIKRAMVIYPELLKAKGLEEDKDFWPVLWVHDEVQVEALPEHAETVGQAIVAAFSVAGEKLGVRCRLDGEYKIGATWAETH